MTVGVTQAEQSLFEVENSQVKDLWLFLEFTDPYTLSPVIVLGKSA